MAHVFSKVMPLLTMVCTKLCNNDVRVNILLSPCCKYGLFLSHNFVYFLTVANAQLRGNNDKDAALIQQFINFADNEILPSAAAWVFPTYGIMQYNKQV
jgi:hypothetical protein